MEQIKQYLALSQEQAEVLDGLFDDLGLEVVAVMREVNQ